MKGEGMRSGGIPGKGTKAGGIGAGRSRGEEDGPRSWRGSVQVVRHLAAVSWRVDRTATAATLFLSLGVALATAGLALAQRWVVDELRRPGGAGAGLVWAVVIGAAAQTLWTIGARLRNTFRSGVISKIDVDLTKEVVTDIARVPGVEHLERSDYLDRVFLAVKGTYSLAGYGLQLVDVATAAISLGVSVWLLTAVDPRLVLLTAVSLVTLALGNRAQRAVRRANSAAAAASRLELHLHNLCLDSAAAKEIRVAGSGPELSRRAETVWDEVTRQYTAARLRGAGITLLGWCCYAIGLGVALVLTARQVVSGTAGVGSLVLVVSLASQLRAQLGLLQEGWSKAAEGGEVSGHYLWLKEYAASADRHGEPAPARLATGITLEDVGFHYPGSEQAALGPISAQIPPGSIVGLVGINGAGKTTLIKLLTGLHQPTEGRILVDGTPLTSIDPRSWAAASCGVFQDFAKFEFLARESVGVGDLPRIDDTEAVAGALAEAQAWKVVDGLEEGLESQLGGSQGGAELSHGQWQRIALARGLMRVEPRLLILDEPTAALDPQAEHDLYEIFAKQARAAAERTGAITFLVSHRFSTVDMADRIIVIVDGRVAESGSHEELMRSGGRYAQLYAAQAAAYATTSAQ